MSPHPPILLGTISMIDSLILMVMALVVFGPRRLPQIGRQIGKLMYEFRKASNDFKFQMEEELRASEEADRRKKEEERQRSLAALAASEQASVSADPVPPLNSTSRPIRAKQPIPSSTHPNLRQSNPRPRRLSPSIMPPSIGETVAAARPNRAYEPLQRRRQATPPPPTLLRRSPSRRILSSTQSPGSGGRGGTEPPWLMPWTQSARRGPQSQNAQISQA